MMDAYEYFMDAMEAAKGNPDYDHMDYHRMCETMCDTILSLKEYAEDTTEKDVHSWVKGWQDDELSRMAFRKEPLHNTKYSRTWYDHIGQLVRIGWNCSKEDYVRVREMMVELKDIIDKCDDTEKEG